MRAELEAYLRDLGFLPILSERTTSNFEVPGDRDAVATCLENVKRASAFVCVLSQRYGGRQPEWDNLSTTHLEYKTACDAGIPVHVYVRDRLRAEYEVWCNNPGATFTWISPGEHSVFELMREHDARAKDRKGNWLTTYRSSVDLKVLLGRDLGARARTYRLRQILEQGNAPTVIPSLNSSTGTGEFLNLQLLWKNIGASPALEVHALDRKDDGQPEALLQLGHFAPGEQKEAPFNVKVRPGKQPMVLVRYCIPTGEIIEDTHQVLNPNRAPHLWLSWRRLVDGWGIYLGDPETFSATIPK
jgi:hypothetical protein